VYTTFARQRLQRRIIALVAAYAIALTSLFATLSAVRAAVTDATSSGIVICQPTLLGQTAPTGMPRDCDSCCIGCATLLAALPPAPTASVAIEQTQGFLLPAPATEKLPFDPQVRSHQSRGPPRAA